MTLPKNRLLPEFKNPPLIETVFSVQFKVPKEYQHIYAQDVWDLYKDNFPHIQENGELRTNFEVFGGSASKNGPQVELISGAEGNRYWFIKEDETELLQFQKNRFLHNWRRIETEGNEYPRFKKTFSSYKTELQELQNLYISKGWDKLEINQCEVNYINHISLENSKDRPLNILKNIPHEFTDNLEDYSFNLIQVILSEGKKDPIGRLLTKVTTARDMQNKQLLVIEITARGAPNTPDIKGALTTIEQFRNKIVHSFADITSDEMHKVWGKTT